MISERLKQVAEVVRRKAEAYITENMSDQDPGDLHQKEGMERVLGMLDKVASETEDHAAVLEAAEADRLYRLGWEDAKRWLKKEELNNQNPPLTPPEQEM